MTKKNKSRRARSAGKSKPKASISRRSRKPSPSSSVPTAKKRKPTPSKNKSRQPSRSSSSSSRSRSSSIPKSKTKRRSSRSSSSASKSKSAVVTKPKNAKRKPSPSALIKKAAIDRNRLNSKLYRLRQKEQQQLRKRKKNRDKKLLSSLRREIKTHIATRSNINSKIGSLRKKQKRFDTLKEKKAAKKSRMRTIDKKLQKLWDDGAYKTKEYSELNTEYMRTAEDVHRINEKLGIEIPVAPLKEQDKEAISESVSDILSIEGKGWEAYPSTPHTIWQAMQHLNDALNSGLYKIYFIDGARFPSSDPSGILMAASNFWRTIRTELNGTPYVIISVNKSIDAVKYEPYETA